MAQPVQHIPPRPARMSLANVTKGKQARPVKLVVYGPEGVGKSTFASEAELPIFLCTEDGTAQLDVARFPTPQNWADVLEAVRALTHEEHSYKTLVIDTLDWLEPLCWKHVCALGGKNSIEDFGYGKGYVAAVEHWRHLLASLELLQRTRKVHVIALAHASAKNHKDPSQDAFQRWQLRLRGEAADLWKEWSDAVFFARHETFTKKDGSKVKGLSTGARILHTKWTAAWDAKSRFALPDTLPLSWAEFRAAALDAATLRARALELVDAIAEDKRAVARQSVTEAGDDVHRLAALVNRLNALVLESLPNKE